MRHPQLVDVFRRSALRRAADVRVAINQSWQHVHPCGVNLLNAFGRTVRLPNRDFRIAYAFDLFDPVVFDDDVNRAKRRSARAVNHRRAANDQTLKWAFAFATTAIRRWLDTPLSRLSLRKYDEANES